jgi:hypothetical protein
MWEFVRSNAPTLVLALVALACPLMHIFGRRHRGRGDGGTRS